MFEHRFGEFDQVPCDCADRERCCASVRVSASSGAGNKRVFDDENGRNGARKEGFSLARSGCSKTLFSLRHLGNTLPMMDIPKVIQPYRANNLVDENQPPVDLDLRCSAILPGK